MEDELTLFSKHKNSLLLFIGTICSIFSIGKLNIPITIYIWPFCFLHYLHINDNKIRSLIKVYICILIANFIRWFGSGDYNILYELIIGFYFTIPTSIPYIIDLIFYKKISKSKSVFIYPLTIGFVEYIFSFSPLSNNNLLAYSQLDNLCFLQIISLFGAFFLSFIIALFASILDYSIEIYQKEKKLSKFMYYYIIINIIIYLYGGIILIIPYNKDTFRAVSVRGVSQLDLVKNENYMMPLDSYYEYINDTLAKAKSINADFISYAEEAFSFEEENYDKFINKVLDMIKYYKIDTLLSLDIHYKKEEIPNKRNMNMFIQSNGEIKYNYTKHNLLPFAEVDYFPTDEPLQVVNTKYGKLSAVICYDVNYPIFINSLSKMNLDILIVPSWDYSSVAEFQSQEARYKAIEGGFNLIKNTADGVVIASDYKGRILSYFFGFENQDYFIVSEVYKHGVVTLYSYIGQWFNLIYLLGIFIVIYWPENELNEKVKIKNN